MKKLATILSAMAITVGAFAQGTINFNNGIGLLVSTNSTSRGGTVGNAAPALGSWYYGVFTAASTTTTIDASLQGLLSGAWTFDGIYATNASIPTGGRFNGGAPVATTAGWSPGVTNSFLVLGWSTSLGTDWATLSAELNGATLSGGQWTGGHFTTDGAFLGASAISFGAAGGGSAGLPPFSVMSTAGPNGQGNPISSGFQMFVVTVPEPGTFALAGLGAAALLIFRRRK